MLLQDPMQNSGYDATKQKRELFLVEEFVVRLGAGFIITDRKTKLIFCIGTHALALTVSENHQSESWKPRFFKGVLSDWFSFAFACIAYQHLGSG